MFVTIIEIVSMQLLLKRLYLLSITNYSLFKEILLMLMLILRIKK